MSGLSNRSNQATSPLPASAALESAGEDVIDSRRLREWIAGVSPDEAVSNLMICQWACQASARLMADIDRMVVAGVDEKNS